MKLLPTKVTLADTEEEIKLIKARRLLQTKQPFYCSLLYTCDLYTDPAIPTACTDGARIVFGTEALQRWSTIQIAAVLAHELLHIAHLHHTRQGAHELFPWQMATDYAINGILHEHNFQLPGNCLFNSAYKGMSAEQIYKIIYEEAMQEMATLAQQAKGKKTQQQGQQQQAAMPVPTPGGSIPDPGSGNDDADDDDPSPGTDPGDALREAEWNVGQVEDVAKIFDQAQIKEIEAEVRVSIIKAQMHANTLKEPSTIADGLLNSHVKKVSWQQHLRNFVNVSTDKVDYTWARPNRRHFANDIYLPTLKDEKKFDNHYAILIDVSGSIQRHQLKRFATALNSIFADMPSCTATLIYFDTMVTHTQTVTKDQMPLKISATGGGGTNFIPAFERIKDEFPNSPPTAIMVFTDLECYSYPGEAPASPTMWVDFDHGSYKCCEDYFPPFGEIVEMD